MKTLRRPTTTRNVLQAMQHTNVIICLPTFKCPFDTSLFNCRVETFNNLLYLDILTHGHAFLLDSNLNLQYDYSMFDRYTGSIKHRGLPRIFKYLLDLITGITEQSDITQIDIIKSKKPAKPNDFFSRLSTSTLLISKYGSIFYALLSIL